MDYYKIILSEIKQPIWENWYIKGDYIGEGNFSRVYRVEAERFGRTDVSALKIEPIIPDELYCDEEQKKDILERKKHLVKTESDIMYALRDCPYIVQYQDEKNGELYIDNILEGYYFLLRMEFLTPVDKIIKNRELDCSEKNIIKLAKDIGRGIKAAHDKGYIHRDIKPANFFVSDNGVYKLGDFNVSKKNTIARSFAGSDGYMAPEIFRINSDDTYTGQADIYSFGICLYRFMNNFYFPFEEKGKVYADTAIEKRMRGESFPKPENASEEFGRIILKACAFDTSERYQTIDEMLTDLKNINISGPSESYVPVETPALNYNNATQYAGEDSELIFTETDFDDMLYETDLSDFIIENSILIKYHGNAQYVKIPDIVKKIGYCAFRDCENLISVIIPYSVNIIGKRAFFACENLTSVKISDGVTEIGEAAFVKCESLTSVAIPDSVTKIGKRAFVYCKRLTSVTMPDSVTEIGENVFFACESLNPINQTEETPEESPESSTSYETLSETDSADFEIKDGVLIGYHGNAEHVKIPDTVKKIGYRAFADCKSLTSVTIPDGVKIIGYEAFYKCESLTSVTIPDSVTIIEKRAFAVCESLTSVTIPYSVTIIEEATFSHCESLTSVIIPDRVKIIETIAFWGCKSLTSIIIPDSVTTIEMNAFSGCKNLTSVTIPDNVTTIGTGAFGYCNSLTSVTMPRRFEERISKIFFYCPKVNISYTDEVKEEKITFIDRVKKLFKK